jgi:hypothetical protein
VTTDPMLRRAAWARSIYLGIASIVCLIMGGSLAARSFPRAESAQVIVDLLGGPWVFAVPFLVAGLCGLVCTVAGWQAPGVILCMGALFGFWGLLYLGLWIAGIQPGGYVAAMWLVLIDALLFGLTLLPARRS